MRETRHCANEGARYSTKRETCFPGFSTSCNLITTFPLSTGETHGVCTSVYSDTRSFACAPLVYISENAENIGCDTRIYSANETRRIHKSKSRAPATTLLLLLKVISFSDDLFLPLITTSRPCFVKVGYF